MRRIDGKRISRRELLYVGDGKEERQKPDGRYQQKCSSVAAFIATFGSHQLGSEL